MKKNIRSSIISPLPFCVPQPYEVFCNDKNRSREESENDTNLSLCVTQRYSGSARKAEELNQEKHKKVLTTEYYYPPALRTHMR